ncbi:heterokaryon incompatibility protein-domain-containing protein [Nemania sp. FL0031]|nr:heterokaryon incompatibility protein-domain-containing protein [Nemania sp. FL0031]
MSSSVMGNRCEGCEKLWYYLTHTKSEGYIKSEDFSHRSCSHHDALIQQFWKEDEEPKKEGEGRKQEPRIEKKSYHDSPVIVDSNTDRWDIMLVNDAAVPNHPGRYRSLNDWVDTNLLLRWKNWCLNHGEECHNPMKIWPVRPAWLIDAERKCLVVGLKPNDRYVALSYTYGTGPSFKITEQEMLSKLQEPDSLDISKESSFIPPIIKHAMYLTAVLGERFLWADGFCIPHYNNRITAEQLNSMGAIYAYAFITIIVTDSNSGRGILGLKGLSDPREITQRIERFGGESIIMRPPFIRKSPYNRRGWTYQEGAMSCRRLMFTQEEVIWECSCGYRREGMLASSEARPVSSPTYGMDTISVGFPDTEPLSHIFSKFNERELSYDEDAFPSIAGLLSVFSRTFRGGFLYGLPEMFFDGALGWHRGGGGIPGGVKRHRVSPDRAELSRGPLDFRHGRGSGGRIIPPRILAILWFTAESPTANASQRRRIHSTWYGDREIYKSLSDPRKPLPAGWTRHKAPKRVGGDRVIYPEGCGSWVFTHEAIEAEEKNVRVFDRRTDWWYYPVPVADISASTLPFTPVQTEYLFCETYRVQLWAYRRHLANPDDIENSGNWIADLFNAEREKVGFLEAMIAIEDFPFTVGVGESISEVTRGKQVELVAISRVKRYEGHGVTNERITTTEQMVALWVEWINGVAYRLGCGEVEKEEWDKLPLEHIELVLG